MPEPPHLLQVFLLQLTNPPYSTTLLAEISFTVVLADAQPAALFAPASLAVVLADALVSELLTLFSKGLCSHMPDLPGSTLGFGGSDSKVTVTLKIISHE